MSDERSAATRLTTWRQPLEYANGQRRWQTDLNQFRFVVTTDDGATFTPWTDGWAVGFKVTAEGHRIAAFYLATRPATPGMSPTPTYSST
jgi:hypothetical protein